MNHEVSCGANNRSMPYTRCRDRKLPAFSLYSKQFTREPWNWSLVELPASIKLERDTAGWFNEGEPFVAPLAPHAWLLADNGLSGLRAERKGHRTEAWLVTERPSHLEHQKRVSRRIIASWDTYTRNFELCHKKGKGGERRGKGPELRREQTEGPEALTYQLEGKDSLGFSSIRPLQFRAEYCVQILPTKLTGSRFTGSSQVLASFSYAEARQSREG